MSSNHSIPRRRFVRIADKAVVAGVCAGLAEYFGFNLKATRVLAVISLFMAMPVTLLIYFGTVFLVPTASTRDIRGHEDPEFHRALRASPTQTLSDVKRRFQLLDGRLARLERYVTSSRFDLDQEFRKL